MVLNAVIAVVIGYLLGAIPFAYLAGRLVKGVDIRQTGGGNVGALNTIREVGKIPGLVVLVADIGKGSLAVLVAGWLGLPLPWIFAAGLAAVIGHNWPVFLNFRGGKGAATTIGVFLALMPLESAISLAVIAVIIVITSNFRLAIVVGLALLPFIIWQFNGSGMLIAYSLVLYLLLCLRSMPSTVAILTSAGGKKGFVFDREYHFWQTKKSR